MPDPLIGPWVIPAASAAFRHRNEIQKQWGRVVSAMLGKRSDIAFTGMSGVGKTVLFQHLSGTAFTYGYSPPGTSPQVEKGSLDELRKVGQPSPKKQRIRIRVIPGQMKAYERTETLDDIFRSEQPVDGVVHVVSNGYITLRQPAAERALVDKFNLDTVDAYRDYQLQQELKDLDEICELIRASKRKHGSPSWMLVAVTKADLFANDSDLQKAEHYYSPHGSSKFVERIRDLQGHVGSDNFVWDAVPVCAWLEDFRWNQQTVPTTLKVNQRDELIWQLSQRLRQYCLG